MESGKKHGFNDIALELRFDESNEKVYIMELKLRRIDSSHDAKVTAAHTANLKEAVAQVKSYKWTKTKDAGELHRMALSGVWCPEKSHENTCCLYTAVEVVS